jgi:hypothetical protein
VKLEHIRAEIERMRYQISRQRKEIQSLQRAELVLGPEVDVARSAILRNHPLFSWNEQGAEFLVLRYLNEVSPNMWI